MKDDRFKTILFQQNLEVACFFTNLDSIQEPMLLICFHMAERVLVERRNKEKKRRSFFFHHGYHLAVASEVPAVRTKHSMEYSKKTMLLIHLP
jgi:hypothetical protein